MNQRIALKVLGTTLALSGPLSLSGAAWATPDCRNNNDQAQLTAGRQIGTGLVEQAFAGIERDLDRIEEFKATVIRVVSTTLRAAVSGPPSRAVACRAQGLIDGVIARLDALQADTGCGEEGCENASFPAPLSSRSIALQRRRFFFCWMDGVFWGELSAELYCSLSIELDGLAPLGLELPPPADNCCGLGFEIACNLKFASDATGDPACFPYTVPPHEEVYVENRAISCAFEL